MSFTPLAACTYETRITNIHKAQETNLRNYGYEHSPRKQKTMQVLPTSTRRPATTSTPPVHHRRRWCRSRKTRRPPQPMVEKLAGSHLDMGQVTRILKRGEELPALKNIGGAASASDVAVIFSGSSFYCPPSPSSLPVPAFLTDKKKQRVTRLCQDEEALDLELLELGFLAFPA